MRYNITDIDWCVEPQDCDNNTEMAYEICSSLPTNCIVECENEDEIVEALSDEYGYLVNGFSFD